ncbi:unnamed protein product [Gongylonema pulchrum]|uniref:Sodium/hydrogen exchanger 8 n=1 Tax=Gongylonema pulchrum TaxID=637853 RepID=A0A183EIV1_9BILA|nr:unnamed protein product [Gongylonema pulchrum]
MANACYRFQESSSNDTTKPPILAVDEQSEAAQEKRSSFAIFFILLVIVAATLLVHVLIISKLYFIPESLAIVILGALVGLVLSYSKSDWTQVETFSPNIFFLVLLPPIIFESGYNLHKGDFFANMFPILSFAIIGTVISALTIGSALYILGQADLIYKITAAESFTFGSMISAVDPVATLAIFQALNLFKHVDLRKTPALELALLLIFAYLPYGLAEAISLSGIMAILFCSITMSQYTHFNISPITQITMQQTFRTIAFVAETCTFAYLGLALFTFKLEFRPMFIVWSILLCFIGRALNVFPLAFVANSCRRSQISFKNQFIMWYSGMRGAVAFALALHISIENEETKRVLLTTTLCIVLFTIIFLGGTTLPLLRVNFFLFC